jgi:hypothetical protein
MALLNDFVEWVWVNVPPKAEHACINTAGYRKKTMVNGRNSGRCGYRRFDIAMQWQMEENPHVSYSSSFT